MYRSLRSHLNPGRRRFPGLNFLNQGNFYYGHAVSGFVPSSLCSSRYKSKFAYPEGMIPIEEDWADEPEYPDIPETHNWVIERRERRQKVIDYHETIRKASCPETKIYQYNYPHRFGYANFRVDETFFDYDSQDAYKFITRTHIASRNELPSQYSSPELNEKVQHFKEKIKGPLLDVLSFELNLPRSFEKDFNASLQSLDLQKSQSIIPQINRVILSVLGKEIDYFKDCHVDVKPKVEAFWEIGGLQPSNTLRTMRKLVSKTKFAFARPKYVKPEDPMHSHIHYIGDSLLQVRYKDPPENLVHPSDPLCQRSREEHPDMFPYRLQSYGFRFPKDGPKYRYCSVIPGHWSGDENRCNLVAFHGRHHLLVRERVGNKYWETQEETEDALFSQAMLVSFGRLVAQALFHGFDHYTDVEYPFSTQTILTNGLEWSFFAYQLNTMKLDKLSIVKNMKQNILWGTKSEHIFDKEKKGELNDVVLENILKFYLNPPKRIQLENPTPYLTRKIQEDWGEDELERAVKFYNFRLMCAQRAYVTDALLTHRPPEIYEWEWIYKIFIKARPLDKRLRHFEIPKDQPGAQPWIEPYIDHDPYRFSKGIVRLFQMTEERLEKERIEAEKKSEAERLGVTAPRKLKKK